MDDREMSYDERQYGNQSQALAYFLQSFRTTDIPTSHTPDVIPKNDFPVRQEISWFLIQIPVKSLPGN